MSHIHVIYSYFVINMLLCIWNRVSIRTKNPIAVFLRCATLFDRHHFRSDWSWWHHFYDVQHVYFIFTHVLFYNQTVAKLLNDVNFTHTNSCILVSLLWIKIENFTRFENVTKNKTFFLSLKARRIQKKNLHSHATCILNGINLLNARLLSHTLLSIAFIFSISLTVVKL